MSRIGKKIISIPENVKVNLAGNNISVEGPKGTLSYEFRSEVDVSYDDSAKSISVSMDAALIAKKRSNGAYWGTTRSLISNMVEGVAKGYEKKLQVVGVGWTCNRQWHRLGTQSWLCQHNLDAYSNRFDRHR